MSTVYIIQVSCPLLVSSNHVSVLWPVDAVKPLCYIVIAQVFHLLRGDIVVIVATLTMVTEAVCVFHTKIIALSVSKHGEHEQAILHRKGESLSEQMCGDVYIGNE